MKCIWIIPFIVCSLIYADCKPTYANNVYSETMLEQDDAFDAALTGEEVTYPYIENKVYTVYARKGFITDIRFAAGEKITAVAAGDTERWIIDRAQTGTGRMMSDHLYIKPVYGSISTNMVINTNLRTYQLNLISGNYYNHTVSFTHHKSKLESTNQIKNYASVNMDKLNFNYKFNNEELSWAPAKVFDDGKKTYIKMKPEVFSSEMPAFFIMDEHNKVVLTNYRVIKGMYIVDRLFDKAQLVVGKEKVKIERKD